MNIILVYPPRRKYQNYGQDKRWIPLGIASLAAYINKNVQDVNITCLDLFNYSLKEGLAKIIEKIKHDDINIIGYTVFTEQRISTFKIAEALKQYYINTMRTDNSFKYKLINVCGGPHASLLGEQIISNYRYIDYVCKVEGEKSIVKIINAYKNNEFRQLDKIIESEHVDMKNLPHSIEGLEFFDELTDLNQEAAIIMSRGCTDFCSFCSTTKVWKGYRARTAFDTFKEMLKYEQYFGITKFKFHDDACTGDINEWKKLCKIILQYKKQWQYEITARIDHFDNELIDLLQKSGCHTIAVGIESGNDKLRKKMNKKLNIDKAIKNCKKIKDVGIKLICMFVVGYPGETQDTINDTKKLIREIKPNMVFRQPLMIFPGTKNYRDCVKDNAIDDNYWLEDIPQPYYIKEQLSNADYTFNELQQLCLDIDTALRPIKILIAAPVHQDKETFTRYLDSINNQKLEDYVFVNKCFVLDNCKELQELDELNKEDTLLIINNDNINYNTTDYTHDWQIDNLQKVANFKNHIIKIALENNFDYVFWVDSDIILHENTLQHLLNQQKDIISEIFWTQWTPEQQEMPNAWDCDHYTFMQDKIWEQWRNKSVYEVGGTGACILVNTKVYATGVNYSMIPNVSWSIWEDRAFCIKAQCNGFRIFLDSHYPANHLYRKNIEKLKNKI